MRKTLILAVLFVPAVCISAENPGARTTIFARIGNSYPFAGHWGDDSIGFMTSSSGNLMLIRDYDENFSYGLQLGYAPNYKNKGTPMKLKVFSFTPTLFSWLGTSRHRYFVYGGSGIYQWKQPAFLTYGSDSGTQFGVNLGAGVLYDFFFRLRWGLNLEWNHIFNMKGDNFDMNSANNLDVNLVFCKRW